MNYLFVSSTAGENVLPWRSKSPARAAEPGRYCVLTLSSSRLRQPGIQRHPHGATALHYGHKIRTVREVLGHSGVATAMVYTHVIRPGGSALRSQLDRICLPVVNQSRREP